MDLRERDFCFEPRGQLSHLLKSAEPVNKVIKSEDDVHVAADGKVGQERTKIAKAGDLLHRLGLLGEQPGSRF